jgi:hypothetical protein
MKHKVHSASEKLEARTQLATTRQGIFASTIAFMVVENVGGRSGKLL